ncbi:hypothetical protein BJF83_08880 [Nocardiopsis sp. CNR-923]|uniref:DUF742 domain-containing protein n=1 Tax=Nocardiopsis sp. CNR-923 TaxID=1904965 RepID=UPI00095992AE|nr:DUF742 domain-containing protein [Nocardiopsis sp. CNR-923]OLT30082.1 hypothetical protein BJF83_08880 [Nocardiopsis sp. CNR-923]
MAGRDHARGVAAPRVPVRNAPRVTVHDSLSAAPWPEAAAGGEAGRERFLRPFAVDAGHPDGAGARDHGRGADLVGHVVAARTPGRGEWLRPERAAILEHARHARTLVELAVEVRLPVGQVRAIVADLVDDGALQVCGPSRPLDRQDILHAVLVGLRSL